MAARKRFTEEQIIAVLQEADAGLKTADLCRKHNVSDATVYKWKAKYAGMEVSDVRRMRGLEDEHHRLKQLVANQALDIEALKALNSKNYLSPKENGRRSCSLSKTLGYRSSGRPGWHSCSGRAFTTRLGCTVTTQE